MVLTEVNVNCFKNEECSEYITKFKSLVGRYESRKNFRKKFRYLLFEDRIKSLNYVLYKETDSYYLTIDISLKKEIENIIVNEKGKSFGNLNISRINGLKEGEFFSEKRLEEARSKITRYLRDKGYYSSRVQSSVKEVGNNVDVVLDVFLGKPVIIEDIQILSDDELIKNRLYRKLKVFKDKPADLALLKLEVEGFSSSLNAQGFFFAKAVLDVPAINSNTQQIIPVVKVERGEKFIFGIYGNENVPKQEILSKLKKSMRRKIRGNIEKSFKKIILDHYEEKGFWETKVNSRMLSSGFNDTGLIEKRYFFDIIEGKRVRVNSITFNNNVFFSDEELLGLYRERGSDVASRMLFDEKFAFRFQQILQDEYVKSGHIFAKVKLNKIEREEGTFNVDLDYFIDEGTSSIVQKVKLVNVDESLSAEIKEMLTNQDGKEYNPFKIDEDIKIVERELKQRGYLFSEIKSKHPKDLILYSADFRNVQIIYDIDLKNRIRLNEIVVGGNFRTKEKVIIRESGLYPNEVLSSDKIENYQSRLSSLGIFANVKIDYISLGSYQKNKEGGRDEYINLLVQVKEKDAGYFEVAPGYRTDIGLKVSSTVGHNNIGKMNRSARIQGQVNQRLNFDTLDARRRAAEKDQIEYTLRANYIEPYLFGFPLAWQTSASISEKRFFSFDAKISKLNTSLRKNWTDQFATSLSYQLEAIKQTDASNEIDEGFFRIGGITPGVTLDLRDNPVNTQKGIFLDWSVELANPTFYSLDREDLEINFYKFVARNKFYFPLFDGVFAISTSFGVQKNLANEIIMDASGNAVTRGFIPSIKVFRLNGVDLVRGFDDDEINIVETGRDINDETVRNKAYFTNFKLEYRHYLRDDIILGTFVDGGRIYFESFSPHSFRSSAGLSLKYLTPVGSLDFDYGFKLHRKRKPDGTLESPGRFHVSIGFF